MVFTRTEEAMHSWRTSLSMPSMQNLDLLFRKQTLRTTEEQELQSLLQIRIKEVLGCLIKGKAT